jgi:hypothetical protein
MGISSVSFRRIRQLSESSLRPDLSREGMIVLVTVSETDSSAFDSLEMDIVVVKTAYHDWLDIRSSIADVKFLGKVYSPQLPSSAKKLKIWSPEMIRFATALPVREPGFDYLQG